MLLSLVVIFTQSIQLSKIVERIALLLYRYRALGRLEAFLLKVQSRSLEEQGLNLKQTSLGEDLYRVIMVELSGIEPLTPCLQSRCSPN